MDLPDCKEDNKKARELAIAFGIPKKNIKSITNKSGPEVDKIFNKLKRDIYNKTEDGKQIFLMVYCAGHGVSDQQQYMVMN